MRPIIYATLNFGMVFVPVGVCATASRKDIRFRTLHVDCGTPIKQHNRCEQCDISHPDEVETVKGWEVAKGQFVHVEPEELEAFSVGRQRLISLSKFVDATDIDPVLVERTYYLSPNDKLAQPYELLSSGLMQENVAGVGKASLWGKEYPVAVVSYHGVLQLKILYCADEIQSDAEIAAFVKLDQNGDEMSLVKQFIDMKRGKLDWGGDLTSDSRQRTMLYLEKKAQGADVEALPEPPEPEMTFNAMDALKASLVAAAKS